MTMIHFLKNHEKDFEQLLLNYGFDTKVAHDLNILILCGCITVIAIAANYLLKFIIKKFVKNWVDKSTNTYDDIFYEKGVFNTLSHLAPALLISYLSAIPLAEVKYADFLYFVKTASSLYIVIVVLLVINSIINALQTIFSGLEATKNRSMKGYVQFVKSLVFFFGGLLIISILVKKDLTTLFTGLTAFAAVLMFIFKDVILGLIAGIQISSNDILRVGDSIEMPQKNIEGTVIDITLSTVKIHNQNRTISTVPSYAFVSESFMSWRGLDISDGRRIRQFIHIDAKTIRFCNQSDFETLVKLPLISLFIADISKEAANSLDPAHAITNLELFREYADKYIRSTGYINEDMTFVIRILQGNEHGLPLEVIVFTREKQLYPYEKSKAEIFEHLIAMLPEFGLRIFQKPVGEDFRKA
jgi:miniconductance mechanosensitive channel